MVQTRHQLYHFFKSFLYSLTYNSFFGKIFASTTRSTSRLLKYCYTLYNITRINYNDAKNITEGSILPTKLILIVIANLVDEKDQFHKAGRRFFSFPFQFWCVNSVEGFFW